MVVRGETDRLCEISMKNLYRKKLYLRHETALPSIGLYDNSTRYIQILRFRKSLAKIEHLSWDNGLFALKARINVREPGVKKIFHKI